MLLYRKLNYLNRALIGFIHPEASTHIDSVQGNAPSAGGRTMDTQPVCLQSMQVSEGHGQE